MIGEDDIDGLAAEYVLGSLDLSQRKEVDRRRGTDTTLDEAVKAWENRLGALVHRLPGIEPPAHLLESILSRLSSQGAQVVQLSAHRKARVVWRPLAVGSGTLAACVALFVVWFTFVHSGPPTTLVAELHRSGATADESAGPRSPVFVVTVDLKARTVMVRPIAARSRPGRSYQLWALRPGAAAPDSLGVISQAEAITVSLPSSYPPGEFVDAALSVSLEPEGGSPTGRPTGPVMFVGKLAPAGQ